MRVLITGGSRGIGRACVERFSMDGHEVAFIFKSDVVSADALVQKFGVTAIQADLSDGVSAEMAMKKALAAHYPKNFDPKIFGENAGLAQQYIFYYARSGNV